MAVDIRIDGVLKANAENFTVSEDSTPVDPSDSTGGTGQISFSIPEDDDSKSFLDQLVDLEDQAQGTTQGIARSLSSTDGSLTVTADSRMALLSATKSAAPFSGTLEAAFTYYLSLVGITDHFLVDDSIADLPVVFPGWQGEVFLQTKRMAMSIGAETTLVSDNIVLRPVRGRVAQAYRDITKTWQLDSSESARSVEVYYYESNYQSNFLAYPTGGWNEDVQIYTVDSGETQVIDLEMSASLLSIQQPLPQDYVSSEYSASSVYAIIGQDGLPYPAAQWVTNGGSVSGAINEDTKSLTLTIVGAVDDDNAPFGLKMSAGDSSFYSSLRLVGTGVFYDKKMVTILTGADSARATTDVGATIDIEFIQSYEQALDVGVWAAAKWAGPRHTLNASTSGINRRGDTGSYRYPTIAEFNTENAGLLVSGFNSVWAGMSVEQFNEYWKAKVATDFANQAFGNVAGARVPAQDAWFRIRSASISAGGVSYSAEMDTTVGDFNTAWGAGDNLLSDPNLARSTLPVAGTSMGTFAIASLNGISYAKGQATATTVANFLLTPNVNRPSVKAGDTVFASARIYNPNVASKTFRILLRFYDAAGAILGTDLATTGSSSVAVAAGASAVFSVNAVAPAGTLSAQIIAERLATGLVGDQLWITDSYLGLKDNAAVPTVATFNTEWAGKEIREFNVRPLRRAA